MVLKALARIVNDDLAFGSQGRHMITHGLLTPREEIAFTARQKIQSQSQIFRYGGSIFCLPHRPNFSDNVCHAEKHTKHSSNTLLRMVRFSA